MPAVPARGDGRPPPLAWPKPAVRRFFTRWHGDGYTLATRSTTGVAVKVLCCALLALLALDARAAEVYKLDPAQTRVAFDVKRFGIPWVRAWFQDLSGDFVVDREGPDSRID